jgi:hypothetical protein
MQHAGDLAQRQFLVESFIGEQQLPYRMLLSLSGDRPDNEI